MKNYKFKLGLTLFMLGLIGVFSLLTIEFSTESLPPEVLEQFSKSTLKWLSLINPTFLLILAVVAGTLLHDKVKLGVPTIGRAIRGEFRGSILAAQLKVGLTGGFLAGVLLLLVEQVFKSLLIREFAELGANVQFSPLARFLYGGITEEILLRFGLMTFLVWLLSRISKTLSPAIYWIAILLSAFLFAAAHLPVAFQAVGDPSSNLILYILLGNTIGGIIFGWLYWKKGLEAAFIGHISAHVVILLAEALI